MNTSRGLFAIILLTIAACSIGKPARDLTPDAAFLQAAKAPVEFDGREVKVRAWISFRHEDKNLWATWRDHENWETTRCISLVNYDVLDESLDGRFVEVSGILKSDASNNGELIRLASCRNVAIEISGREAIRVLP